MANQIVTCRTEGCENKDIELHFEDALPLVLCGACWQEITDKVNVDAGK